MFSLCNGLFTQPDVCFGCGRGTGGSLRRKVGYLAASRHPLDIEKGDMLASFGKKKYYIWFSGTVRPSDSVLIFILTDYI